MKKVFGIVLALILSLSICAFVTGCDDSAPDKPALKDFTGVSFGDKAVTYDGTEHEILISGDLPDGAKVAYTQNKATDAGTYNARAVLTCSGYNDKTLTATLTVNKADITGITFEGKTVHGDGTPKSITYGGVLPQGTTAEITYDGKKTDGVTEDGTHSVKLAISGKNYNTYEKTVTLRIITMSGLAKAVVDSLLAKPDPWSFVPQGLSYENMAYTQEPVTDFTNFVQVSQIGKRAVGKQLNVLYEGLDDAATLLGYIDNVYAVGTTIADLYQTYINSNPDNYGEFKSEAGGFKILIKLDGDDSILLAGNSLVSVELYNFAESGKRAGRVQISDGMALKYESTDTELKFAVKKTVKGIGITQQIEFARNDNAVAGLMYEYVGTQGTSAIKTTAEILFDDKYARIVSDKRETDDLKINGYEEVYDSVTGEFIGGEVAETMSKKEFDTLWFMLGDISGFNSVKVEDKRNYLNADTVYLNGATDSMHTVTDGIVNPSRHFDVEMKEVYYFKKVVENNKTKYEKVKTEIPMLFVQKENTDTFGEDVKEKNKNEFPTPPVLPQDKQTVITAVFGQLQELFLKFKAQGSAQAITDYIGNKHPLFAKVQ